MSEEEAFMLWELRKEKKSGENHRKKANGDALRALKILEEFQVDSSLILDCRNTLVVMIFRYD